MNNGIHVFMAQILKMYFDRNFSLYEQIGIHPRQSPLLLALDDEDGINQKELADKLLVSPPTVAVSIKRLERGGYIYKVTDEKDQRVSRLYLTDAGKAVCTKCKAIIDHMNLEIFDDFTIAETQLFKNMLEKIRTNILTASLSNEGLKRELE
jgi:DNA-binding MarR family transcriptional regulator